MKRLIAAIFGSLFTAGCSGDATSPALKASDWEVGGIYSIDNGDGSFGIAKILVIEPEIVHIRVYKNKFRSRPETVDLASLSLGSIDDTDGFGMGHLPISTRSFAGWKPDLVERSEIAADELEGYEMWKEASGGVFN